MKDEFTGKMAGGMAIAGAVIIPLGLIISGVFGGWKGLAGSFVGFAVASLNTAAAMATLKWVMKKPAGLMPTLMLATMWGRLLVLAGALFGLTYVKALNTLAMLFSFLALFMAYTVIEFIFAYKGFGAILKSGKNTGTKL